MSMSRSIREDWFLMHGVRTSFCFCGTLDVESLLFWPITLIFHNVIFHTAMNISSSFVFNMPDHLMVAIVMMIVIMIITINIFVQWSIWKLVEMLREARFGQILKQILQSLWIGCGRWYQLCGKLFRRIAHVSDRTISKVVTPENRQPYAVMQR